MTSKKQAKAISDFWLVVKAKMAQSPKADEDDLRAGIDYMLAQMPTWAVEKATKWLREWKP